MYASFLRISDALHLGIFHQPPKYPVLRQGPRDRFDLPGASPMQLALGDVLWLILNQKARFSSPLVFFVAIKDGGWNSILSIICLSPFL